MGRFKKLTTYLLATSMAFGVLGVNAFAYDEIDVTEDIEAWEAYEQETEIDEDEVDFDEVDIGISLFEEEPLEGDGTKSSPYQVSNAEQLSQAVNSGGHIELTDSFTIKGALIVTEDVTIDLNGETLTFDPIASVIDGKISYYTVGFNVKESLTIDDSGNNGKITISSSVDNLTVKTKYRLIQILGGAEVTLNDGIIENTCLDYNASPTIANYGTLNINGGEVTGVNPIFTFAPWLGNDDWKGKNAYVNIDGGNIEGVPCTAVNGNEDADGVGTSWGLTWFGLGVAGISGSKYDGEDGTYDNEAVQINISGGTISGGQGLGTNASGGIYAGYTLNISGGEIIGVGEEGTGMYIPAVGKTTITGGTIKGEQAIRIAAGEMEITGGTIISTVESDEQDLIAGGSGGTKGAIVAGKAGSGYYGDLVINIKEGAEIKNTNSENAPAIVVSDKNMAGSNYEDNKIVVNVDGAKIDGDVIKISNVKEDGDTEDGGNTSLTVNNSVITGNVKNQSKTNIVVTDSTIEGNVTNTNEGNTTVLGSTVEGEVEDNGSGSVYVEGVTEETSDISAVNASTGNTYESIVEAVNEAKDGETVMLTKSVEVTDGGNSKNSGAINVSKNIIIDGNGHTLKAADNYVSAGSTAGSVHMINIVNGAKVTVKDITIDGNNLSKHGVNVYDSQADLDKVTIKNCNGYAVVSNSSKLEVTDITTDGSNSWGGINVDNKTNNGSEFVMNSGTIGEDNSLCIENSNNEEIDAVIKDGTFEGNIILQNVEESRDVNLVIKDAVVKGNVAEVTKDETGKITVNEETTGMIEIEDGKFSNDVSDYVDEDKHLVKDKDGNYVVMDEEEYEDYLDDNKSHGSSFELEEKENNRKDDDDKDKEEDKKPEEPEEESIFSDVAINDPNYDAIVKVFEKGWMVGVSDGVFAPNGTLTRGMAATILWNKAGKPEPVNAAPFLDVTADAWYAKAVAWAYEQGIVLGYDAETFGPNDFVTTEQFTIMLDKSEGKTPAPYAGGAPNATRAWVASKIA